jgi:hypothetical protein
LVQVQRGRVVRVHLAGAQAPQAVGAALEERVEALQRGSGIALVEPPQQFLAQAPHALLGLQEQAFAGLGPQLHGMPGDDRYEAVGGHLHRGVSQHRQQHQQRQKQSPY